MVSPPELACGRQAYMPWQVCAPWWRASNGTLVHARLKENENHQGSRQINEVT